MIRMILECGEYHSDSGRETLWMMVVRFAVYRSRGTCWIEWGRQESFAPNQTTSRRSLGTCDCSERFARHCDRRD